MPKVTIDVPAGWTKNDLDAFLKYVNRDGDERVVATTTTKHHCFRNEPCRFWVQTGENEYQGDCGLCSCTCLTTVFNGLNPPRWWAKEQ